MNLKFFENENFYKPLLFTSVFIGCYIRLSGLDLQSLWLDELYSVSACSYKFFDMISIWLLRDLHPPLYQLILFFWVKLAGNSEIMVRMPSVTAGIFTIIGIYFLSSKIFNRYVALSASILTSLSASAIVYSQEARPYSFLMLFSALSTLLLINAVKKISTGELKSKDFIIYCIFCSLTAFTHYFGAGLIFFQLIYIIFAALQYKNSIKPFILLSLALAFVFIPWLMLHFHFVSVPDNSFWIKSPDLSSFIALTNFLFNKKLVIFLFLPVFLSISCCIKELREKKARIMPDSSVICLLYILLAPVIAVFLLSNKANVFYPRYFIIILPAFYLLVSLLTSKNPFFNGIKGNIYIFSLSFIAFVLFLFVKGNNVWDNDESFFKPFKQQYRESAKYIMENYNSQNSIIYLDKYPLLYLYYFKRYNKDTKLALIYPNNPSKAQINSVKSKFNNIFVISNFFPAKQENLFSLKEEGFSCNEKAFIDIYIYDCKLAKKPLKQDHD